MGLTLAGCAATSAPQDWLPRADAAQYEGFGAWIKVNLTKDTITEHKYTTVMGELLAVEADSLFILGEDNQLIGISQDEVYKARLTYYNSQFGSLTAWTFIGALSTGSHGIGSIISLPVWVLSGIAATASQSRSPMVNYPPEAWAMLYKYARFPQGFPPQFDRSQLNKKSKKK